VAQISDITLVAQVAVFHNKRAFDQLVRKYQSPVRRFFLTQTLGDSQLSDDLAQDTFIKAYEHIASFKGMAEFQTWLMRIAYNVLYDYRRRQKPTSDVETLMKPTGGDSIAGLKMDLYKALSLLKPDERACITLQLIEGHPINKVAEIMQMPEGTVKSHLSRGKKQLTNYLKQNGYG
jgi:RNA polymerase sigma-70 factor (ECF subfamily)